MILPALPAIGLTEFALRASTRRASGDWLALSAPDHLEPRQLADEVAQEIEALGAAQPVVRLHASDGARALTQAAAAHLDSTVVVSGLEGWTHDEWQRLDGLRSLWARRGSVVLIGHASSMAAWLSGAPNVATWAGGALWQLDAAEAILGEEQRRARLAALEAWAGRTSDDVLTLAARGELPVAPEYAEWLVLLCRGDLLANR